MHVTKRVTNVDLIGFVSVTGSKWVVTHVEEIKINPETALMNEIRVTASQYGICFRANVGKVKMIDGRWFDTGLPKGFSDLFGVRQSDGKTFFIEVKTDTGKVRDSQKKFIKRMKELNAIAGVARNVEEAIELIETGANKITEEMIYAKL